MQSKRCENNFNLIHSFRYFTIKFCLNNIKFHGNIRNCIEFVINAQNAFKFIEINMRKKKF